jgi:hypothetical protein
MLWQARAEIKAPRHGRIEPSGKVRRHRCGAAQPVGSERSPVSSRRAQHMSQAVVVPTFSCAGRDEARARRRPDPNCLAARRFELAQTLTVWRKPNGNRSEGGARRWQTWNTHQLRIDSRRPRLPTMLPRTAVRVAAKHRTVTGATHLKDTCMCTRAHTDAHVHTRAQRCARAGCERLGDASERSHLCSKSLSLAYGFASKRRAHLNGFDQSLHRRRACTGSGHTWRRPHSSSSLRAPSSL